MTLAETGFFAAQAIPPAYAHQSSTTQFALDRQRVYIGSDPGTGKTRSCLDVVVALKKKALVLAPKGILESAWCADAAQFAPSLRVVPCYAANREKAFKQHADVYVTNHDAAKWLAENSWAYRDCGILIMDEITAYKNKDAQRSRAMARVASTFETRIGMCGTPMPQGLVDIWHQMLLVDDGQRLGRSFYAFRNATHLPIPKPGQVHVMWEEKPGAREIVADLIADVFIRYELESCIDMPEKIERFVTYTPNAKTTKAYREMLEHSRIVMNDASVTAVNAAALLTKLMQISSGAVYAPDGSVVEVDSQRSDLIAALCAEREHTLVAFQWTHQKESLLRSLAQEGIDKTQVAVIDGSAKGKTSQIVEQFQAGKYRVLLAHPKSASHGLTLTRGTTTIWAAPTPELERFLQFNRRIYRAGQKKRTEFIFIKANDTADERMYDRLMSKADAQNNLLSILKALCN